MDAHTGLSEELSTELRSLHVDPPRQPLLLDKMFDRATRWQSNIASGSTGAATMAPSSSRLKAPEVYPLQLPLSPAEEPGEYHASPLAPLFDYPELLPHVLKWFERPAEMATLARVSRSFQEIVYKRLYGQIWIRPWEQHCNTKLILLFRTLHGRGDLGRLVRSLDVRFYPLATIDTERYELDDRVHSALRHMVNLEHLVWTRDKSLNPEMVETISTMQRLRSLEISGHSERYYDPSALGRLPMLDDLRVMMPDSLFRDKLRGLLRTLSERKRGGLRGLGIIARNSPLVDDAMLRDVAEHLTHLQRLTLWGCTRVTRSGVYEVLHEATSLQELSIDALPHSGLTHLADAPSLASLTTLSLSFSSASLPRIHQEYPSSELPILPSPLPNLTSLFLNLSSVKHDLSGDGIHVLAECINFRRLTRLSILNLFCDSAHLSAILALSPGLQELYISIKGEHVLREALDIVAPGSITGSASRGPQLGSELRTLHVIVPERWAPSPDDLAEVAEKLPRLEQVGSGTRIYEVQRRFGPKGKIRVELNRWGRTTTPGYFQIWRG